MDESVIQRIQAARAAAASDVDKLKAQVDRAERWRKLLDAVSESADARPAMTARRPRWQTGTRSETS